MPLGSRGPKLVVPIRRRIRSFRERPPEHAGATGSPPSPRFSEDLRELLRGGRPPAPLSMPAPQTLAIVAYKQPVSAPEIHAIRRVEALGVIRTLLTRNLIAAVGRKNDAGHALFYKTTRQFRSTSASGI